MKRSTLSFLTILLTSCLSFSQKLDSNQVMINQIEKSINYKSGIIELESGNAILTVPTGYKYIDKKQTRYVLEDLWGNPADSSILGILLPSNQGILEENGWAFIIYFDEMGYVKDDDAEDIDYDDLLKETQKEVNDANPQRIKEGYEPVTLIGWASKPFYNKELNTLHWAKEIKFGEAKVNTLNYNLRILGRKGIFNFTAIARMNNLPVVQSNIDKIIQSVKFKEGHRYSDYDSTSDNVAAYTIGGLVAGKVLAKVGFFAVILKFWKLILLGIAGLGTTIWKKLKGKKGEDLPPAGPETEVNKDIV